MRRSEGFTLAEVLVTLGIIGVVAAMTLPALITRNQNKALEAGLKKNYSVILQAFEMYQAQHGERLKPEILGGGNSNTGLKAQIMPYFKILVDCGTDGANKQKQCAYANHPYKTYNGSSLSKTKFDDGQFVLQDGSLILIEDMVGARERLISVDVNGRNKNPNKWGHDIFTFEITKDGAIIPSGAPSSYYKNKTQYCSINSTDAYNGIGCTYYALNDKDYFNNLPR